MILVTGGLGFIGSHTVVELQNEGFEVVIVDNLSNSSIDVLDKITKITGKQPLFEEIDLRDKQAVHQLFKKYTTISGVIHFAASKAVGESVENPLLYYENNLNSLIYLLQEGRNIGLANKLRSYHLQNQGLDTLAANWHLGFSADERSFELATILLKHLGISSIQLLSNNPLKSQALQAGGIKIDRMVPMLGRRNAFNQDYLKTKKQKMGHHLS